MNKEKALKALAGAVSADINKPLTNFEITENADFLQFGKQNFEAVCLVCRQPHQRTKGLEVFIFRNRQASGSFGLCRACERDLSKSTQLLRIRLDSIEQNEKRGAK